MANSTFTPKQRKGLLAVVLILLAIRFVGVPLIEHQEEQRNSLEMTTQQLERALVLLDNDSFLADENTVTEDLNVLESQLVEHKNTNAFRLTVQQQIEKLTKKHDVDIQVFNWLAVRSELNGYLANHQGQVELEGAVTDIARTQMEMTQEMFGLRVLEFRMQPMRGTVRRGEMKVPVARVNVLFEAVGIEKEVSQ